MILIPGSRAAGPVNYAAVRRRVKAKGGSGLSGQPPAFHGFAFMKE